MLHKPRSAIGAWFPCWIQFHPELPFSWCGVGVSSSAYSFTKIQELPQCWDVRRGWNLHHWPDPLSFCCCQASGFLAMLGAQVPWVPSPRGTTWPLPSDPATHWGTHHSQDQLAACIVFPVEGTAFFYHLPGCILSTTIFCIPPPWKQESILIMCWGWGWDESNGEECMRTNSDGYPDTSPPYHPCSMSRCGPETQPTQSRQQM